MTPHWDKSKLQVTQGERVVTKPFMARKNQRRNATKRKSKGEGGRRSRAKFDRKGYEQYKRQQGTRQGPFNPFVRISDPTIFDKKPCGRKPLTYQERSEGSKRARRRLLEEGKKRVAKRRVKNSSRALGGSGSQVIPIISEPCLTKGPQEQPRPAIPIISSPTPKGPQEQPRPAIPIISTPTPSMVSLNAYLMSQQYGAYLMSQQYGTGFPLILPKGPRNTSF